MTNKAGGAQAATDGTSKGGELHPAGGHSHILTINRHYTITQGKDSSNSLTTATGGHGVVYYAVEVIVVYLAAGSLQDKVVYTLPLPKLGINDLSLLHWLIRSGRINLVGSFTVHPVIGTTQASSLRTNHTDMARCERLTQGA